jgi:hypothetical protein
MDQEPTFGRSRRIGAMIIGTTMVLGGVVWGASAASATDTTPSPGTSTAVMVCSATVGTDGTVHVSGDCNAANSTVQQSPAGGTVVTSGDVTSGTLVPLPAGKVGRLMIGKGTLQAGSGVMKFEGGPVIVGSQLHVVRGAGSITVSGPATAVPLSGGVTK